MLAVDVQDKYFLFDNGVMHRISKSIQRNNPNTFIPQLEHKGIKLYSPQLLIKIF